MSFEQVSKLETHSYHSQRKKAVVVTIIVDHVKTARVWSLLFLGILEGTNLGHTANQPYVAYTRQESLNSTLVWRATTGMKGVAVILDKVSLRVEAEREREAAESARPGVSFVRPGFIAPRRGDGLP